MFNTPEDMNEEDAAREMVKIGHPKILWAMSKHSNPTIKILSARKPGPHIENLVHDKNELVREAAVRYCDPKHHDKLVYDPSQLVQRRVAVYGTDKHRDILLSNPETTNLVKEAIASRGNDRHRAKLLKDKSPMVREAVADNANAEHARILKNDTNPIVASAAKWRLLHLGEGPDPSLSNTLNSNGRG